MHTSGETAGEPEHLCVPSGRDVLEQSELVIAEVNSNLPVLSTDGEYHHLVHVSEVDVIVESDHALAENVPAPITELDRQIAGHIAEMVPDGACIQLGLGGCPMPSGNAWPMRGRKTWGCTQKWSPTASWS